MKTNNFTARLMQMLRDNAQAERKPLNVVRNEAAKEATIYIYDVIDSYWGVNDQDIARAVSELPKDTWIKARVNSPGGDVFTGRAIATTFANHPGKVTAYVDGLAASAATTVCDSADEIVMAKGSFYMIHNSWTVAAGNKSAFMDTAALLAKIDGEIAADYVQRTGKTVEEIVQLMDAETWFTAQEAFDNGFATSVAEKVSKAENSAKRWNLAAFTNVPKALLEMPEPAPENEWARMHEANARRLQLFSLSTA